MTDVPPDVRRDIDRLRSICAYLGLGELRLMACLDVWVTEWKTEILSNAETRMNDGPIYKSAEADKWFDRYVQAVGERDAALAEAQKYHDLLLLEQMKTPEAKELDIADGAANSVADKLRAIAETGIHRGVFGGEKIEAAAQVILRLRAEFLATREAVTAGLEFAAKVYNQGEDDDETCLALARFDAKVAVWRATREVKT